MHSGLISMATPKFWPVLCMVILNVAAAPAQIAPSAKRPPDEGQSSVTSEAVSRTRLSKFRPFLGAVRHQSNILKPESYDGQNVTVI
jgi:hypothetical protein